MIRFPEFSGIKRGVCWADMNGDGRDDCLVSDPDAGLLNVFLSNQQEGWDEPRIFPSLTGSAGTDCDGLGARWGFGGFFAQQR